MELEVQFEKKTGTLTYRIIAAGKKINKILALKQLEIVKEDIASTFDGDIEIVELDEEAHIHKHDRKEVLRGIAQKSHKR